MARVLIASLRATIIRDEGESSQQYAAEPHECTQFANGVSRGLLGGRHLIEKREAHVLVLLRLGGLGGLACHAHRSGVSASEAQGSLLRCTRRG
jgi:hypothetical protein